MAQEKFINNITERLVSQGNSPGGGLLSPDKQSWVLTMPKNASTFISHWLLENNWVILSAADLTKNSTDYYKQTNVIAIVLRDPVERWMSGIAQYIISYHLPRQSMVEFINLWNPLVETLLFDIICWFDDHTWPQYYFVDDVLLDAPRIYFYIDKDFEYNFKQHFNLNLPSNNIDRNKSDDKQFYIKKELIGFIWLKLKQRPHLMQKVMDAYKRDYDLINTVKFVRYTEQL
jgi:hypothetical protein